MMDNELSNIDMARLLTDSSIFVKHLNKVRGERNLSFFDYVSVEDLKSQDLELIFSVASVFKQFVLSPEKKLPILKGKSIINLFFESSTRTKISFELGGKHLGADTINFSAKMSSTEKGETIGDTARTINSMKADLIICRGAAAGVPEMIIKELDCPVINAGDGWHEHPTQALFDVYTIFENMGVLKGVKMCVIGDIMHSRVAGSLLRLANMLEMDLSICAPLTLIPEHVEQFTDKIYTDLDEVLPEMDVLYSLRIQEERGASGAIPSLREYARCYGKNDIYLQGIQTYC